MFFGIIAAPKIFTKLMKPVVALLYLKGIRLVIYLDGILILADSIQQSIAQTKEVLLVLTELRWIINWKKSYLLSAQVQEYLSLKIDSYNMIFKVPSKKIKEIRKEATSILLGLSRKKKRSFYIFLPLF
jgi:hypothetical protein